MELALIVDADHGGAVRRDDLLRDGLGCEAAVFLLVSIGFASCRAVQSLSISINLFVAQAVQGLLVVLHRISHVVAAGVADGYRLILGSLGHLKADLGSISVKAGEGGAGYYAGVERCALLHNGHIGLGSHRIGGGEYVVHSEGDSFQRGVDRLNCQVLLNVGEVGGLPAAEHKVLSAGAGWSHGARALGNGLSLQNAVVMVCEGDGEVLDLFLLRTAILGGSAETGIEKRRRLGLILAFVLVLILLLAVVFGFLGKDRGVRRSKAAGAQVAAVGGDLSGWLGVIDPV